jgi:hypothetical protein
MMKPILMAVLLALPAAGGNAQTATLDAAASYDLLFREGTLDGIDRQKALVYRRDVANSLVPAADARDSGEVALGFRDGDATTALLTFRQGEAHRVLGTFPASVGNPIIMYFYETVVRDMAESAGGSQFYIRNRVKDALVVPASVDRGQATVDGTTVDTTTIHLHPFTDDPNRDRMKGFGDLVLSVTMSEAVPGWYVSLIAEAKGEAGSVYRSALTFDGIEEAQ